MSGRDGITVTGTARNVDMVPTRYEILDGVTRQIIGTATRLEDKQWEFKVRADAHPSGKEDTYRAATIEAIEQAAAIIATAVRARQKAEEDLRGLVEAARPTDVVDALRDLTRPRS